MITMAELSPAVPPKRLQLTLEPLEAMEFARNAESVGDAWDKMQAKLNDAGFANCSFAIARRSVDTPLSHPETRSYGPFVSKDLTQAMIRFPEMQRLSPALRQIRRSAQPVASFDDETDSSLTALEQEAWQNFSRRFGLKSRAIVPFHAPGADCIMAVGWWDFGDPVTAKAHWERNRAAFCLATTYFCQGILTAFRPLDDAPENLSPRESECLLWAAAGRRSCEIAAIIGIAESTVDEYVKRAMKKLGAQTRSQACVNAVTHGLFNP